MGVPLSWHLGFSVATNMQVARVLATLKYWKLSCQSHTIWYLGILSPSDQKTVGLISFHIQMLRVFGKATLSLLKLQGPSWMLSMSWDLECQTLGTTGLASLCRHDHPVEAKLHDVWSSFLAHRRSTSDHLKSISKSSLGWSESRFFNCQVNQSTVPPCF